MAANGSSVECIELDNDSGSDDSSVDGFAVPCSAKMPPSSADFDQSSDSDSDESLLGGVTVFAKNSSSSSSLGHKPATATTTTEVSRMTAMPKPKLTKQQREEQRRKERLQKEEEKLRERVRKQAEREKRRAEQEASKQAEQEFKKRRLLQAQQTSGKFAPQEIAMLVHSDLLQRMDTETIQDTYAIRPDSNGIIPGSIRWIRKDHAAGGATDAIQAFESGNRKGYQLLDRMVICFYEPTQFINLLYRTGEDDDFPLLEAWLDSLNFSYRGKLVLMLNQVTDDLHRAWNAHKRSFSNHPPPPTDAELQDAIVWLLIQFQVECIICPSEDYLVEKLRKMTRALSEEPYQQQVTELECVRKIKGDCPDDADSYTRAHDCWIRQLQQVPGVSEGMARNVAQYFPTARSLYEAYHQNETLSPDEKRLLLAPLFHEKRKFHKLADVVYRLFTSANPNEFL